MALFVGLVTLVLALVISGVAAYFSVVGLAAIFAATFLPVVIMGGALEAGKLVAAGWLHANWHNPRVNWFLKTYLCLAIFVLMLITAIGIYGFLARGHLEQEAPLASVALQIEQIETRIARAERDRDAALARMQQLDESIDVFFRNDRATQGLQARAAQADERAAIQAEIDAANDLVGDLMEEMVPLRAKIADVEAKLGPIKYAAALLGVEEPQAAVQIIILALMFAFDPLAVALVIASTISIGQWLAERRERKAAKAPPPPLPEPKDDVAPTRSETMPVFVVGEPITTKFIPERNVKVDIPDEVVNNREVENSSEAIAEDTKPDAYTTPVSHSAQNAGNSGWLSAPWFQRDK